MSTLIWAQAVPVLSQHVESLEVWADAKLQYIYMHVTVELV